MESSNDHYESINRTIHTYSASILRFAYSYVKNRSDAEDIAQDVLVTFIQKAPVFENEAHEKSWIMKVTSNKCKDFLGSFWKKRMSDIPEDFASPVPKESSLLFYVFKLDEKYRTPVHLFYYEGYSIIEIAEITGKKPATVGTRLARARALLKSMIGDDLFEQ